MNTLRLEISDHRKRAKPGDTIQGRVTWRCSETPDEVEVRLFWYTSGKGTRDVEVIKRECFTNPAPQGERSFSFELPAGPYSFSGKLISLTWAVEAILEPQGDVDRHEFVVSPTESEVRLQPIDGSTL